MVSGIFAGDVERLNKQDYVSEFLTCSICVPAAGQGSLAVLVRSSDDAVKKHLQSINDALKRMAPDYPLFGYLFEGTRYDAGNKLGFLKATVEYALDDPELGVDFKKYLKSLKF